MGQSTAKAVRKFQFVLIIIGQLLVVLITFSNAQAVDLANKFDNVELNMVSSSLSEKTSTIDTKLEKPNHNVAKGVRFASKSSLSATNDKSKTQVEGAIAGDNTSNLKTSNGSNQKIKQSIEMKTIKPAGAAEPSLQNNGSLLGQKSKQISGTNAIANNGNGPNDLNQAAGHKKKKYMIIKKKKKKPKKVKKMKVYIKKKPKKKKKKYIKVKVPVKKMKKKKKVKIVKVHKKKKKHHHHHF